jgi:hypothetical protein
MADTDPISYEVLKKGTRVVTATGTEIGTVEHVLADDTLDLFDGIVVKTNDGLRFVTAEQDQGHRLNEWFGRTFLREHWTRKNDDEGGR